MPGRISAIEISAGRSGGRLILTSNNDSCVRSFDAAAFTPTVLASALSGVAGESAEPARAGAPPLHAPCAASVPFSPSPSRHAALSAAFAPFPPSTVDHRGRIPAGGGGGAPGREPSLLLSHGSVPVSKDPRRQLEVLRSKCAALFSLYGVPLGRHSLPLLPFF